MLLTRATDEQAEAALPANPGGARTGTHRRVAPGRTPAPSASCVVTAGTADLPVADECAATLAAYGVDADRASPTSASPASTACSPRSTRSPTADAVVVVAGMEGALASRRRRPHRRRRSSPCRPASGYGAALEGVTALLAMLASCAAGLTVVGIDNGFGAACAVARAIDAHG